MASLDSEWNFLQCFGERTPGEDIQEGESALRNLPHLHGRVSRFWLASTMPWEPLESAMPSDGLILNAMVLSRHDRVAFSRPDIESIGMQRTSYQPLSSTTMASTWQRVIEEEESCYLKELTLHQW